MSRKASDAVRDGAVAAQAARSEHLSSERRRGLEEAAKVCHALCRNNWSGFAQTCASGCSVAYVDEDCPCEHATTVWDSDAKEILRALIPPSSEGGEEKTDPIREELARALEEVLAAVERSDFVYVENITRAALSKPPAKCRACGQTKGTAATTCWNSDIPGKLHDWDHPPAVASGGSRRE